MSKVKKEDIEQYFTLKEVAALIKVTQRTILNWIDAGKIIPTELPSGVYGKPALRFTATAVRDCLRERRPEVVREQEKWLKRQADTIQERETVIETLVKMMQEQLKAVKALIEDPEKTVNYMALVNRHIAQLKKLEQSQTDYEGLSDDLTKFALLYKELLKDEQDNND